MSTYKSRPVVSLSPREIEVMYLVSEGLTNGEVAAKLYISEETVKSHVKNVMAKTRTRNRTHAAVALIASGTI